MYNVYLIEAFDLDVDSIYNVNVATLSHGSNTLFNLI